MVEGGMKCIKYLLFAFNFLFFIAGLGLIICGAVVQTKFRVYFDFFGGSFSSVAILLIVVGCIIFVIGFFGCCGAVKENYCMVMTFSVLLSIIFIIEIAAGIAAFVMRKDLEAQVEKQMLAGMQNYNKSEGVTKLWDNTQKDMKCCGTVNSTDWLQTPYKKIPKSCCKDTACSSPYTMGCMPMMKEYLDENIFVVAGVGIGLAFVQIIGVIFACCLSRSIRKEYEVV